MPSTIVFWGVALRSAPIWLKQALIGRLHKRISRRSDRSLSADQSAMLDATLGPAEPGDLAERRSAAPRYWGMLRLRDLRPRQSPRELQVVGAHQAPHASRVSTRGALKRQPVTSSTMLAGVAAARRTWAKPASRQTSVSRFSPACAPRPSPTSCDRELGVQIVHEAA